MLPPEWGYDSADTALFSTWFDWALLAFTIATLLIQCYVIVVAIRYSPKEMKDYRSCFL
jgi:hypothetical protein